MSKLLTEKEIRYRAIVKEFNATKNKDKYLNDMYNLTYPYIIEFVNDSRHNWDYLATDELLEEIPHIIMARAENTLKINSFPYIFYRWYYSVTRSLTLKLNKMN